VVDDGLMAFVSKARALQHAADQLEEQGRGEEARAQLRRLIDGPEPDARAPEVREIEADALARLGELESAAGRFEAADQAIDQGLERATEVTLYRGRLFDVRGLCEERRAAALRAAGDEPGAAAATERAIRASEQAVAIQAEVIEKTLGGK
jgi:tetratricopeptide (TPR) repeat protein